MRDATANPTPPPEPPAGRAPTPVEHYDPAEPFDINRHPPASHLDLAIARHVHDLAVPALPALPADAWRPLEADLADRTPAARARHAQLATAVRALAVPALAPDTAARRAEQLLTPLAAHAARFRVAAEQLDRQVHDLAVPVPTPAAWAARAEHLTGTLTDRRHVSDRLEKITRDEPVHPGALDPADRQADWNALEATLRQGRHEAPPAVAPQRWDSMWQRIQHGVQPAQPPTTGTPPANPPAPDARTRTATATAPSATALPRPRRRPWGLFYTALSAAALLLVVAGLWQLLPTTPHHTTGHHAHPPAPSLASAEIIDMGDTDPSITSVVRTTSGKDPVTVVVIVHQ